MNVSPKLRRLIGIFFILLLMMTTPHFARGQYYHVRIGGNETGRDQVEAIIAFEREGAELLLKSRIDDIHHACQLQETDLRILRVAAKGAVDKAFQKRRREIETQLKQYQDRAGIVEKENGVEDRADEDDANRKNKPNNAVANQGRNITFSMTWLKIQSVEDEIIWTSTLKNVLSDAQRSAYEEWLDQRNEYQRIAAVQGFIAKTDRRLFLTPQQKQKLVGIIDEHFGDKLVAQVAKDDLGIRRQEIRQFGARIQIRKPVFHHLVSDVLSEAQLKEWNRTIDLELQKL